MSLQTFVGSHGSLCGSGDKGQEYQDFRRGIVRGGTHANAVKGRRRANKRLTGGLGGNIACLGHFQALAFSLSALWCLFPRLLASPKETAGPADCLKTGLTNGV